jgi:hypothetical protein
MPFNQPDKNPNPPTQQQRRAAADPSSNAPEACAAPAASNLQSQQQQQRDHHPSAPTVSRSAQPSSTNPHRGSMDCDERQHNPPKDH